ncbi:hypothetical protein [Leisingera sp. F5]|uniref:hypothetical protein n=1 Tax=Leisingera sp. F5 TaxID=1813816 RepID=UPI000AA72940|nr:hypothetical protein [Leisingera sp. F5]
MSESSQGAAGARSKRSPTDRGGNFFAVDRDVWERLWEVEATNRLNFISAYLVMSAGTGSDHQLSKWSTKACERHVGIGKPRAKVAIDELIEHGFSAHTEQSSRAYPQYRLQEIPSDSDPIFLPVGMVTGLAAEASLLRRVREVGDPMLLRMLVDLYGLVQIDSTYAVPISALSQVAPEDFPARKVFEIGVHAIWALRLSERLVARGDWTKPHHAKNWTVFWDRLRTLEDIGAIWYEPWVYESSDLDAEPMFPISMLTSHRSKVDPDALRLTNVLRNAAETLAEDRTYLIEMYSEDILVPLSRHRGMPGIRGVARLRIEADTPGRRLSYRERARLLETYESGYAALAREAAMGQYNHPLNTRMAD